MSSDLRRVVLVTGASSGIGRAIALRLAREGYRVFGTSRNPKDVPAAPGIELLKLDVQSEASVQRCFDELQADAGRLDVLVNNAGITQFGPLEETGEETMHDVFDTNLFGVVRVTRRALPIMRAQRSGRIVNVSSLSGRVMFPGGALYAASKHALDGLSASLDEEVAHLGIHVSVVAPSWTRTDVARAARVSKKRLDDYDPIRDRIRGAASRAVEQGEDPERVAAAVARLLRRADPPRYVTVPRYAQWLTIIRFVFPALFRRGLRERFGLPRRQID